MSKVTDSPVVVGRNEYVAFASLISFHCKSNEKYEK